MSTSYRSTCLCSKGGSCASLLVEPDIYDRKQINLFEQGGKNSLLSLTTVRSRPLFATLRELTKEYALITSWVAEVSVKA